MLSSFSLLAAVESLFAVEFVAAPVLFSIARFSDLVFTFSESTRTSCSQPNACIISLVVGGPFFESIAAISVSISVASSMLAWSGVACSSHMCLVEIEDRPLCFNQLKVPSTSFIETELL